MNCDELGALLSAYVDTEVDVLRRHGIARHLSACGVCKTEHDALMRLRGRIGAEVPYFIAPPALKARLHAMANAMASPPKHAAPVFRENWRWLGGGALAGCAASVFAWVVSTAVVTSRADEEFTTAAVTSHVRATLDGHLIEVLSSDRHTVKPWLSARLDYSPPVQDFATEGFPLIGGRIDRLDRHAVATLVYRYGQHTIDVFVRPERWDLGSVTSLRSVRGFNVARARGPSMDWLAVSDAEPAVLEEFVQRLAREGVGN